MADDEPQYPTGPEQSAGPEHLAEPQYAPEAQHPTEPQHPGEPNRLTEPQHLGAPQHPSEPNPSGPYQYGGYAPPPASVPPASVPPVGAPPAYPPPAYPAPQPAGSDGPGRVRRTVLIAAVVAAVVGGGIGAGTVALVDNNSSTGSAGLSQSTQVAPAAKVDGTVTAAAAKIGPSVVTINVSTSQQQDTGSGVIIRADGYILTNNHVISNASSGGTLTVTLKDGRTTTGKVIGTDPSDDLAVVKIGLTGLTAASFASSSSLVVGQTVVAVGAPLGLSDTVTSGIVSNVARPVQTGNTSTSTAVFDAVQTDAAINPGNSGGPLVNLAGDVVGINSAIATDASQGGLQVPGQSSQSGNIGIGFAIPSDEASRIAGELITTGKATHALMGVSVGDVSTSGSTTTGAVVKTVTAGGPAAKAGLKVGDVVTVLDKQLINDSTALVAAVRSHAPEQTVPLTYLRGGASHTVQVTLGSSSG
jgi:putative serine protease PepD